ncbi:aminoacyl tRNA synthase complex-interacting multifunctional protein 2 isoform X1 [Athalia rosae]|uniref:aminoacyl tRNA synthase complex-interacting multifunctional protein 2 isoform X1 n=1 Tax=Athalia rosae TaxID=37344 RepID=UPI0020347D7D|nr:aminoacyl tRNA synthase complex-interacting multifunctional protein 2 isoform X1 [Athalia rosae]
MSGAMTMYALKPIVSMPGEICIPKTMYKMKNIQEIQQQQLSKHASQESKIVSDITEQVIKFLKSPLPEIVDLEIRQEKILVQLAELKKQVSNLCAILNNSNQSKCFSTSAQIIQERVDIDFVVNANPCRPPFSILALQKLWKDTDINISSHIHSSLSTQTPQFPSEPKNFNSTNNRIDLTLIWKNVSDLEVVISGVHGNPLLGEVNLLRYLSRSIASHNYEHISPVESTKIDAVLDLCHGLSFQESHKDVQSSFSVLGRKLGNGEWLLGSIEPSIADVAAWSAIKRLGSGKLPANLNSWFKRCDDTFGHI